MCSVDGGWRLIEVLRMMEVVGLPRVMKVCVGMLRMTVIGWFRDEMVSMVKMEAIAQYSTG
jgi:hypothetical protein